MFDSYNNCVLYVLASVVCWHLVLCCYFGEYGYSVFMDAWFLNMRKTCKQVWPLWMMKNFNKFFIVLFVVVFLVCAMMLHWMGWWYVGFAAICTPFCFIATVKTRNQTY